MKKVLTMMASCAIMVACNPEAKKDESASDRQIILDSISSAERFSKSLDSARAIDEPTVAVVTPEATSPAPSHEGRKTPKGKSPAPSKTENPDKPVAGTPTAVPTSTNAPDSAVVPAGDKTARNDSTAKKKGLNNAAKGAIIGLGTGAAAGAIIGGKGKRVQGAILGGIIGAGAGAVGGAVLDKKKRDKAAKDSAAVRDTIKK